MVHHNSLFVIAVIATMRTGWRWLHGRRGSAGLGIPTCTGKSSKSPAVSRLNPNDCDSIHFVLQ
eukprot:COSAG02_NODE_54_length_43941_cov_54.857990_32_plen_64_part_00